MEGVIHPFELCYEQSRMKQWRWQDRRDSYATYLPYELQSYMYEGAYILT